MKKEFKDLLKSEIRKVKKVATIMSGFDDCVVTGYSYTNDGGDFINVFCEICRSNGKRVDIDVQLLIFMPDRRMSKAYVLKR